jgi:hypothetical protein
MNARIFSGVFPCGISYADREREEHGDYKRLAFLPFDTLQLEIEKSCPPAMAAEIRADAAANFRPGQVFQVSGAGQTVTLGWKRFRVERRERVYDVVRISDGRVVVTGESYTVASRICDMANRGQGDESECGEVAESLLRGDRS